MIMKDRGIIIGACVNNQVSFEEEIIELRNLCEACSIEIVDQMVQNVTGIHPKTYLGSGKVNEFFTYRFAKRRNPLCHGRSEFNLLR